MSSVRFMKPDTGRSGFMKIHYILKSSADLSDRRSSKLPSPIFPNPTKNHPRTPAPNTQGIPKLNRAGYFRRAGKPAGARLQPAGQAHGERLLCAAPAPGHEKAQNGSCGASPATIQDGSPAACPGPAIRAAPGKGMSRQDEGISFPLSNSGYG